MRVSAWCLAAFLFACGRTKGNPFAEASGGEAPSGTNGGASTGGTSTSLGGNPSAGRAGAGSIEGGGGGASSGGAATIQAGTGPALGGAAGMATGTAGTTGVAGTAFGGNAGQTMGGSAGELVGGEAGAAGASACGGPYRACGCGCCSGRQAVKRCYYPEVDGHLERIVTEDQRRAQSADCPMMGCSTAVEYVCCPSAAASAGPADYEASAIPGGIDRLVLERTGEDGRCSKLSIANSVTSPMDVFEIETSNWDAELGQDGACAGGSLRTAVGGVGYVHWSGQPCVVDFDFTLFFPSESGAFEGIRFNAEDVPVVGGGGCP